MSRLLVDELVTELEQTVVPSENLDIQAVYLGLYVANAPGGTVTLELRNASDRLIKASNAVTVSSMKTDTYAHGVFRFDLSATVMKDQTYKLALVPGGGYTYSSTDFVGWKRDFDHTNDDLRRVKISYTGGKGYNAPFDYLPVVRTAVRKGIR